MAAVLIAPDETLLCANDKALALLGDGIEGRNFVNALRQPVALQAVESCLRSKEAGSVRLLTSRDGQDTSYVLNCAYLETPQLQGALVCFEDVTQQEIAGQMRRDFVANVSHELRTPLTALMGFIETLRGPARDDPAARSRFLDIMATEANRMERLVRDLLSLSRVENDERSRPTTKTDLTGLVQSAVHGLGGLAQDAKVTLVTQLPGDPLTVTGDSDQLRQVLNNLVENAIKYSGPNCTVTVTLRAEHQTKSLRNPSALIIVHDTGAGIKPEHLARLTERFYRVDNHRSREMGGTGLGLAIVKHIVSRHRGRLRIQSTVGAGSTFSVTLPIDG